MSKYEVRTRYNTLFEIGAVKYERGEDYVYFTDKNGNTVASFILHEVLYISKAGSVVAVKEDK